MNILLSLLFYNPVEAYTFVLLCDVITGNKRTFEIADVYKLYMFGFINFVFQIIPYLWYGEIIYLPLNIFVAYVVMPIVLKYFYSNVFYKNITMRQAFVCLFISGMFAIIIPSIFDLVFNTNTTFYNYSCLHEFITNSVIFSLQIIFYKIILTKRYEYEKSCKSYRKNNDQ